MATKIVQNLGNIPQIRATYYSENKKPEVALAEGQRVSVQRFKTTTDKVSKVETLRQSFVVLANRITKHQVIQQTEKGGEMIQGLLDELQDSLIRRCADSSLSFDKCESAEFMVSDYFDSSRSASGKRITAEVLGKWFDENGATEFLVERIVAKFPQFDTDKVTAVVKQYRQAMMDLTKYGLPLTKPVTAMLSKFHSEFSYQVDDEMQEYIGERISKLNDKHNADEMLVDAI